MEIFFFAKWKFFFRVFVISQKLVKILRIQCFLGFSNTLNKEEKRKIASEIEKQVH